MKVTKTQLAQIIKEEIRNLQEDTGDDNPDYEVITTMIGRMDGIEAVLAGKMRLQSVDPALKQQALEATSALRDILSQIRAGGMKSFK